MPELLFDDPTHTYMVDGVVKPSVTQIISEFIPFPWDSEAVRRAAAFGTALHKTLELKDAGTLGEYDTALDPWIASWDKYLADMDRSTFKWAYVDIKSGAYMPSWDIQLAAYWKLNEKPEGDVIEGRYYSEKYGYAGTIDRIYEGTGRGIICQDVRLTPKGYKIYTAPRERGFNVFLSMLNVYHFKKEHKLLKQEVFHVRD